MPPSCREGQDVSFCGRPGWTRSQFLTSARARFLQRKPVFSRPVSPSPRGIVLKQGAPSRPLLWLFWPEPLRVYALSHCWPPCLLPLPSARCPHLPLRFLSAPARGFRPPYIPVTPPPSLFQTGGLDSHLRLQTSHLLLDFFSCFRSLALI